ncbi:HEAT repeat-containing protein 6 [Irineochytrium annulatum]|nr:HEAT repeat-containing protein 6 [Irineochytrium annulatum]
MVLPLSKSSNSNTEVRRAALVCLGNLCVRTGSKLQSAHKDIFESLLDAASIDTAAATNSVAAEKVASSALKSMHLLINEGKNVIGDSGPALLAVLQRCVFPPTRSFARGSPGTVPRWPRPQFESDSEISDADSAQQSESYRELQINALSCLQSVAKANPKLLYPRCDYPKVRVAASNALSAFLDGSRQYLSVAEASKSGRSGSFTSLSQKLFEQLGRIHTALVRVVSTELVPSVLIAQLKCLAILVRNAPYDRLEESTKTTLYRTVFGRLEHPDPGAQSASMEVMVAILDVGIALDISGVPDAGLVNPATPPSRLRTAIDVAVDSVSGTRGGPTLQVTSLDLLGALVRRDVLLMFRHWDRVNPVIEAALAGVNGLVRVAALKVVEQYGECLKALDDEKFRIACASITLGMLTDDDPNVKCSACRALGVFVTYASMRDDRLFLLDVATALPTLSADARLNVRVRVSWALANLCDALVVLVQPPPTDTGGDIITGTIGLEEVGFGDSAFDSLVKSSIRLSIDNEKCRSNGVRALGNIIRVCPRKYLIAQAESTVKDAAMAVIKNLEAGAFKNRWNAAHAAQNILRADHIPLVSVSWRDPILTALTTATRSCKNFKVRINAAAALCGPRGGAAVYGGKDKVQAMIKVLEEAKATAGILEDSTFGEFRYKEQLEEQLHQTIEHLSATLK